MTSRPPHLCRSWLLIGGIDRRGLAEVHGCGADVAVLELEDFTPPEARAEARAAAPALFDAWRAAGIVPAVRVNPFFDGGRDDLAAVMAGAPEIVMLPKLRGPEEVVALDQAVTEEETRRGLTPGATRLVPNCEIAAALLSTREIARASDRVIGCLLASEDLATDLGAPRTRESGEIDFARAYFHAACTAEGVVSIDCPYTFADAEGHEAHCARAAALGYRAKSLVAPAHARLVNAAFTPDAAQVAQARRIVEAAAEARARGEARALLDGHLVEVPTLRNAETVLERAEALVALG